MIDHSPASPPPLTRPTYNGVGGLIPQNDAFTPSNVLMGQMPWQLQQQEPNTHISRPATISGNDYGWYDPSTNNVQVQRDVEGGPYSAQEVAEHELLHQLAGEHPSFRDEPTNGYPRLTSAIRASIPTAGYPALGQYLREMATRPDPEHAFTGLASAAMRTPDIIPQPLLDYFAPLLHPAFLQQALNAMSVYGRGPR